jgi:addiction module RelE/StbE family toxin
VYTLSWSKGFQRGFKRAIRKNCELQERIFSTLETLSKEPFRPDLKTHKLHGKLSGLWACEVEYDCRIVFAFEKDPEKGKEIIVLADIGKHDEVY